MTVWGPRNEEHTVSALLRRRAEEIPDRVFMQFGDERVTYGATWERAVAAANAFRDLGVGKGDTVVVQMPNRSEFLDAWFGATLLGAVTVPLNIHLKGEFLRHQLDVANPAVAVVGAKELPRFAEEAKRGTSLAHVLTPDTLDAATASALPWSDVARLGDVMEAYCGKPTPDDTSTWADPTLVLFTSGTTGPSKGAVVSNHYVLASSKAMVDMREANEDDTFWSSLPMFHGNALFQTVLAPMLVGTRGALDPSFSVSRFWPRVREVGATQLSLLGAMITLLWEQPARPDDAVNPARCVIGAPIPAEIHRAWEERFGLRFLTGFGLTEANPLLISTMRELPAPGSAGRRFDLFDVRLFDENDEEVPVGAIGEIVARPRKPYAMFDGYLGNPAATLAANRNMWFHTGDYAREDADGWFYFLDRKKDSIRRRGENVSSWEVECAVGLHPAVAEVAAFGVPSELSEEEVMVAVVVKEGATLAPEDLLDHCTSRMPYFAVPRFVAFVTELPYNDLGKVRKDVLREGGSAAAWDREQAGYVVER